MFAQYSELDWLELKETNQLASDIDKIYFHLQKFRWNAEKLNHYCHQTEIVFQ